MSLLYYLAMKFSTTKKIQKFIQDTGRFTINWLLYENVCWCLYCLSFATDPESLFLLFLFFFSFLFFSFCLQQYATIDNSSLIPYYNTQSELKVLTFGEIMYYQSNNLTTRAIGLCPSFRFFILGSVWLVTFNGIPLLHSALLLHFLFHVFMWKF